MRVVAAHRFRVALRKASAEEDALIVVAEHEPFVLGDEARPEAGRDGLTARSSEGAPTMLTARCLARRERDAEGATRAA